MSSIKIQEAPQTPSYAADPIQVSANIASPQSTMDNVKAGQEQLNSVNTLSGGRHRGTKHQRRRRHKSFIRTYKGRRYTASKQQTGGSTAAANGGQIPVPQVGALCSSGPQCSAVQNANLTALGNQATSSSLNDSYAKGGGGGRRAHRHKKSAHNDHHHHHHQRHSGASHRKTKEYSLQSTIAYNMNKLLRKIFT
jgi:hypothetical protein